MWTSMENRLLFSHVCVLPLLTWGLFKERNTFKENHSSKEDTTRGMLASNFESSSGISPVGCKTEHVYFVCNNIHLFINFIF